MEGKENIYYALGEMAYAVAKADGTVQREERDKIHRIVLEETSHHKLDFDLAEIIFHILKKDDMDANTSYDWAMGEFRTHKQYLTADLVVDFTAVVEKVALAFDSYTKGEKKMVTRFRTELGSLVGM
jgi:uncharacterized tellurite resistance protein B-like protein